jgi:hypothetical protein
VLTSNVPMELHLLALAGLFAAGVLKGATGIGYSSCALLVSLDQQISWFTEDRMVELTRSFGVRPRLTWYDTLVTVDNLKGETRVNGKTLAEAG